MTESSTVGAASRSRRQLRRTVATRRVVALVLVGFLLAGVSTAFGERVDQVTATGGGYALAIEYPTRTRGGLTQDLDVVVRRDGGFDGPVTLTLTTEYSKLFEQQGMHPEPASATADAARLHWTFDAPPGDTLRVLVDVRVEPHRYRGAAGRLTVLHEGVPAVSVPLETAVMP